MTETNDNRKGYFSLLSPENKFLYDLPSLLVNLIVTVHSANQFINAQLHNINAQFSAHFLKNMDTVPCHWLLSELENQMFSLPLIIIKFEQH